MPEVQPGSGDSLVYRKMMEFKTGLLERESQQMRAMARRWVGVERALEAQLELTARELVDLKASGKAVRDPGAIWRVARARTLLEQTQAELTKYGGYAAREIEGEQKTLAGLGLEHAAEGIEATYAEYPEAWQVFNRLPVDRVERMAGLAGDGSLLRDLLARRMNLGLAGPEGAGDILERLTQTLVNGMALGWNPVKTAREMADDLTGGLDKALTIARTEQMWVYNAAKAEAWRASGVVEIRMRISAHDRRVCPACLALDGTYLGLYEVLIDHPLGRCTDVPVVARAPVPRWTAGEDWLRTQDEEVQESILGKGRMEAWKRGEVDFGALAIVKENEWGGTVKTAPYKSTSQASLNS